MIHSMRSDGATKLMNFPPYDHLSIIIRTGGAENVAPLIATVMPKQVPAIIERTVV